VILFIFSFTCLSEMLAEEPLEVIEGECLVRGKQDEAVRGVDQRKLGAIAPAGVDQVLVDD